MNGANDLWYRHPATCFNEALPLGNGRIGACVYGGVKNECISLNEDTLWSGYPRTSQESCAEIYQKARKLVLEQREAEAQTLLEQKFGDFLVQMYLPLGTLCVDMSHGIEAEDYQRSLSLCTAVHSVSYRTDGGHYTRECFISQPAQILVMRIACDRKRSVAFTARFSPKLLCRIFSADDGLYMEGHCPVCLAPHGKTYDGDASQIYSDTDAEKGIGYCGGLKIVAKGGTVTVSDQEIKVGNADEAILYFAVRTSFNGPFRHPVTEGRPYQERCVSDLQSAVNAGIEVLRKESISDYQHLYSRVSLNLGENENSKLPTDERLIKHAQGQRDNALYSLLFNYGRYLTIAASRQGTQAMNLQGIWNEQRTPPWNCNYTLNINTEMNYWPTLSCGLYECYEPLITLTKELRQAGRQTARQYYGAAGFVSHHATDLWRVTHPNTNRLKDSTQWGQWCMSGGWLTTMLFAYYQYTKDIEYLRDIYPVIRDCADFYQSLLIWQNDAWILCPSTSPENKYSTENGFLSLDKTTAMTMQIVHDVFTCACEASRELGYGKTPYEEKIAQLEKGHIAADGVLNEWYTEHEEWDKNHRHMSHLYGLFPSHQFDGCSTEWREACRKSLEKRGDEGTGWSLAWKVNLWATLGDAKRALKLLDRQLRPVNSRDEQHESGGGSYPNLFCAHPPFQIDGNFGACAGIINMLVHATSDAVTLLPALPREWKDGELTGVYLPGRKRLDMQWRDGKVTQKKIYDAERSD